MIKLMLLGLLQHATPEAQKNEGADFMNTKSFIIEINSFTHQQQTF